ncbi:MAG: MraY family glycosyltransferase [Planctomycetota bacterium]|nr:MraY family glycosyltransferase [Planctomycetota bacterium]MDG1985739.1 MraY family glycosyltransferase [Planctomycetota bacterium]
MFFVVFTVALVFTGVLVLIAPALGWFDRREGLEYRKPIEENIPVVGGASILGAIAIAQYLDPLIPLPWPALLGAFLLGLVDDVRRGGLSPAVKLSGQIVVATLLIVIPGPAFVDHTPMELLFMAGLALVAMNAVNLFDHADGMAGTACCLALCPGGPALAAAVGGYLPFNILIRHKKTFRESVPMTMLGDSGTHLLGVVIAVTPAAWWFLLIPVLDAARVMVARVLRGQPFWEGDRTHLGNRLAGIGFGPVSTSLVVLILVGAPLLGRLASGGERIGVGGLAVSVVLYFIAVRATYGHVAPALQTREARPVERDERVAREAERAASDAENWDADADEGILPSTLRLEVRQRAAGAAPSLRAQGLPRPSPGPVRAQEGAGPLTQEWVPLRRRRTSANPFATPPANPFAKPDFPRSASWAHGARRAQEAEAPEADDEFGKHDHPLTGAGPNAGPDQGSVAEAFGDLT